MADDSPDIVVLRSNSRGSTAEDYAEALRQRLPGYDVRLAWTRREERELLATAPVATGVHIDEELLEHADGLELFACVFAGHDHLPLDALRSRDVAVTTGSGIHGPNVAEWVLGHALVFARRLHVGWQRKQRREWRYYKGLELKDSTVTVVGLGPIGQSVVERLRAFDVETIGVRYTPEKGGPTDEVVGFDPDAVDDALARTDYLVLTCPLTETTRGFLDADAFETLRPSAVVLNAARGEIVDTEALVSAIQAGSIRGAALDVTDPEPLPSDHPLWRFENVLITPHNAGGSPQLWERVADIVAENLETVRETGEYANLRNQVDLRDE